jgi:hypothetical protein
MSISGWYHAPEEPAGAQHASLQQLHQAQADAQHAAAPLSRGADLLAAHQYIPIEGMQAEAQAERARHDAEKAKKQGEGQQKKEDAEKGKAQEGQQQQEGDSKEQGKQEGGEGSKEQQQEWQQAGVHAESLSKEDKAFLSRCGLLSCHTCVCVCVCVCG